MEKLYFKRITPRNFDYNTYKKRLEEVVPEIIKDYDATARVIDVQVNLAGIWYSITVKGKDVGLAVSKLEERMVGECWRRESLFESCMDKFSLLNPHSP